MSGDKSYMDTAKETLSSLQQKAADTAGSVQDTLSGTVCPLLTSLMPCLSGCVLGRAICLGIGLSGNMGLRHGTFNGAQAPLSCVGICHWDCIQCCAACRGCLTLCGASSEGRPLGSRSRFFCKLLILLCRQRPPRTRPETTRRLPRTRPAT